MDYPSHRSVVQWILLFMDHRVFTPSVFRVNSIISWGAFYLLMDRTLHLHRFTSTIPTQSIKLIYGWLINIIASIEPQLSIYSR